MHFPQIALTAMWMQKGKPNRLCKSVEIRVWYCGIIVPVQGLEKKLLAIPVRKMLCLAAGCLYAAWLVSSTHAWCPPVPLSILGGVHTHTHIPTYAHLPIHTHIHTHWHAFIYIYIHSHLHTHTHSQICTHTHTFTQIYTRTHSHIFTRIHTHAPTHLHSRALTHMPTFTHMHTHACAHTRLH